MLNSFKTVNSWSVAFLILLGLSWHGGLHAWQVLAACIGVAFLWHQSAQRFLLTWTQFVVLLGLVTWQVLVSVNVLTSLIQCLWLATLYILVQTLRCNEKPSVNRLDWIPSLASGVVLLMFLRSIWVVLQNPQIVWVGTELVAVAVHWFYPNQNLLVVGVFLPGILLAINWIYTKKKGLFAWFAWATLSAGIAYAGSKGGLLALGTAGLWWLSRAYRCDGLKPRWLVCAILLILTLGLSWKLPVAGLQKRAVANSIPQKEDAFRFQRLKFWKASLLASAERPWFGWGQGAYAEAIQRQDVGGELSPRNPIARYRLRLTHAHNEFLEIAVEWGWPLAVMVLALSLVFFWLRWKVIEVSPAEWALEGFLVGVAFHALIDMPLRPAFMQFSYVICIAWLWPNASTQKKADSSIPTIAVLSLAILLSFVAFRKVGFREAPINLAQISRLELNQYLTRRPYDAIAWLELARRAQLNGDVAQQQEALERALWLEPNYWAAWKMKLELANAAHATVQVRLIQVTLNKIRDLVIPVDQLHDPYGLTLLDRK